jgi:hypothetical protein
MFTRKDAVKPVDARLPAVAVIPDMPVFFRRDDGKLGQINVQTVNHKDAIFTVKEALVGSGEGWNAPVLAVIKGGK